MVKMRQRFGRPGQTARPAITCWRRNYGALDSNELVLVANWKLSTELIIDCPAKVSKPIPNSILAPQGSDGLNPACHIMITSSLMSSSPRP